MRNIADRKKSGAPEKKMPFWRSAWRRLFRAPPAAPSFNLENLESRALLSTTPGPALIGVEVLGPVTAINAIVLTFNESLDPTSAQNVTAYTFGKQPPLQSNSDSGLSLDDFFPFRETGHETAATMKPKLVKNGKIQFSSAVYDDTAHTVTLTPLAPFKAQAYFRFLRVKGTGPSAITDPDGIKLNNGKDTVTQWAVNHAKTIRYTDVENDHVTFKLTGPGKLFVFRHRGKDADPAIFVEGATSATTITGTVTKKHTLFPTINVAQIEGITGINNNLLNNSDFLVGATTP